MTSQQSQRRRTEANKKGGLAAMESIRNKAKEEAYRHMANWLEGSVAGLSYQESMEAHVAHFMSTVGINPKLTAPGQEG